MLIKAEINIIR